MALAIAVSLVLGAAGGYGYMRYKGSEDRQALHVLQAERDRLTEQVKRQSADLDEMTLRLMAVEDKTQEGAPDDGEKQRLQQALSEALQDNRRLTERLSSAEKATVDADEQLANLRRQLADLQAGGDAKAAQALREQDRLSKEIPQLKQEIARGRDELARVKAELSRAQDMAKRQTGEAQAAQKKIAELTAALERSDAEQRRLQAELAQARTRPDNAGSQPDNAPAVTRQRVRAETDVEMALEKTPGLARLSEPQRQELKRQLMDGACVATALESAFGRVPLITLRNMIRDLNSDC